MLFRGVKDILGLQDNAIRGIYGLTELNEKITTCRICGGKENGPCSKLNNMGKKSSFYLKQSIRITFNPSIQTATFHFEDGDKTIPFNRVVGLYLALKAGLNYLAKSQKIVDDNDIELLDQKF